jgi:hypothetical protein
MALTPETDPSTLYRPASESSPPTGRRIPDGRHRRALRSTRIIRGEQCAEAPLGCRRSDPAAGFRCSRQPRALQVVSLPSRQVAERTRVPPTAIRFGVPAASWCQDVRCPLCLARPVRVLRQRPRVQRPPVQRPASGACPASACPVSARLCPIPRCPCPVSRARVRRRVSGVRCERPASRACRACVRPIRTCDFVEREGAAGSHASRTGAVGVSPTVFATSSPAAQVEVWCLELAALAAAASAGPPAAVVEALGWRPGSTLGRQGHAGCAQDRPSAEQPVRGGSPTGTGCVQVGRSVLSACCRPRPESLGRGWSALGPR